MINWGRYNTKKVQNLFESTQKRIKHQEQLLPLCLYTITVIENIPD